MHFWKSPNPCESQSVSSCTQYFHNDALLIRAGWKTFTCSEIALLQDIYPYPMCIHLYHLDVQFHILYPIYNQAQR